MELVILGLAVLLAGTSVSLVAATLLWRQALTGRDRLLDERERVIGELQARLVDLWRDLEEKETRITTLEHGNERLQRLAADATEGWRDAVMERARVP